MEKKLRHENASRKVVGIVKFVMRHGCEKKQRLVCKLCCYTISYIEARVE